VTLEIMYDHMWHGLRLLATPYRVPYSKRLYKLRVVTLAGHSGFTLAAVRSLPDFTN